MAVRFDSNTDVLVNSTNIPQNNFSFTCWVYVSVNTGTFTTFVFINPNVGSTIYTVLQADDGTTLKMFTSDGSTSTTTTLGSMTVGTWYKVGVTISSTNSMRLYFGPATGALTAIGPVTIAAKTTSKLWLGNDSSSEPLNGRMAAFKMFNAELTADEIATELGQYQPARLDVLNRYHPFINAPDLIDYSGKGNTLTAGTTATTQEDGPPIRWGVPRRNVGGLAPVVVNAGIDDIVDQYEPVIRTAGETGNTASVTAREWTVVSGPNEVGNTIGTSASLVWAPTVDGVYVIRYSATNAAGVGTDDFTLTVNHLNFPVTGNLILGGSVAAHKSISSARTAPLILSTSIVALKKASSSRTANIILHGSAIGQKINVVTALLKLHAAIINVGRPGQGAVTATIRLQGAANNRAHVSNGGTRNGNIRLFGTRTVVPHKSGTVSAGPIRLTGALTARKKAITRTVSFNIKLAASVANRSRTNVAVSMGNIVLTGSVSNRSRTNVGGSVGAALMLLATTVTHSTRSNNTSFGGIRLHAQVFGQRIISEVASIILPRADNTTQYDLVCVARIPQTNGPPLLVEIDPIDWTQISFTEELKAAPSLTISARLSTLTDAVVQRTNNIDELPTELWLFRNGKQIFSGPLLGGNLTGESVELRSLGLESYLNGMYVTSDLSYTNVDQFDIVTGLINQWQILDYGNFGIDTSNLSDSGILRTIVYKYAEGHNVGTRISDLTKMEDGFDMSINPSNRKLELYYPGRGTDRSSGEDAIVFDAVNVTSTDVTFSAVPGDLASEAFGSGTGSGADEVLVSTASNLELRARYGRIGVFANFDQVTDQAALDSFTRALVNARGQVLWIPGPNARVTVDSDISQYDIGDTISYQLASRLSVPTNFRIRKRTIAVTGTGMESVSLEFV